MANNFNYHTKLEPAGNAQLAKEFVPVLNKTMMTPLSKVQIQICNILGVQIVWHTIVVEERASYFNLVSELELHQ